MAQDAHGHAVYSVAAQTLKEPTAAETYMARLNKMIKTVMHEPGSAFAALGTDDAEHPTGAAPAAPASAVAPAPGTSPAAPGMVAATAAVAGKDASGDAADADDADDADADTVADEPILSGSVRAVGFLSFGSRASPFSASGFPFFGRWPGAGHGAPGHQRQHD